MNKGKYRKGGLSQEKAKKLLHEGNFDSDKQRRYFGWVAGGKKQMGGQIPVDPNGYLQSNQDNWAPEMIVPGSNITTDGMAFPIYANGQYLEPNTGDYQFSSPFVHETPAYQYGGPRKIKVKGNGVINFGYNPYANTNAYGLAPEVMGATMQMDMNTGQYYTEGIPQMQNAFGPDGIFAQPTTYQQGGTVGNENYYQSSAQLAYYKGLLNDQLKAKDPKAFSDYFAGLQNARKSGSADKYIENSNYNTYLTPQEVQSTLGNEYQNYINSLQAVNNMNVQQGARPLYGAVEGNNVIDSLNYGRRFASLQMTPTYSATRTSNTGNRSYNRQYTYNPQTHNVDYTETGDMSLRPPTFSSSSVSSNYKKGGKYRKC